MDASLVWTFIESLSNWLYEPLVFWCVPFLPAVALEIFRARGAGSER